jgi:hypothetical protein
MTTDTIDAFRLAKLLGLLGSSHDGEVMNAAKMADRLVRAGGLTWEDVIAPAAAGSPLPPRRHTDPAKGPPAASVLRRWPEHWRAAWALCLSRLDCREITAWERQFLISIRGWEHPTPRQLEVVRNVTAKMVV